MCTLLSTCSSSVFVEESDDLRLHFIQSQIIIMATTTMAMKTTTVIGTTILVIHEIVFPCMLPLRSVKIEQCIGMKMSNMNS